MRYHVRQDDIKKILDCFQEMDLAQMRRFDGVEYLSKKIHAIKTLGFIFVDLLKRDVFENHERARVQVSKELIDEMYSYYRSVQLSSSREDLKRYIEEKLISTLENVFDG